MGTARSSGWVLRMRLHLMMMTFTHHHKTLCAVGYSSELEAQETCIPCCSIYDLSIKVAKEETISLLLRADCWQGQTSKQLFSPQNIDSQKAPSSIWAWCIMARCHPV